MVRGTTPTITFKINNVPTSALSKVQVTLSQDGKVMLEKGIEEVSISGQCISFELTEEETFALSADRVVEFQIRAMAKDGSIIATPIYRDLVYEALNEKPLSGGTGV